MKLALLVVTGLLVAAPLQAAEITGDLSVNGFFGVDATYVDDDFRLPSSGGGAVLYDSHSANLKSSILGAQADYSVSDSLSLTVQGSAFYNSNSNLNGEVDWAYLAYDLGADTKVRVGKFQIPMLQGTELRRIGFSRLWARPLGPDNGAGGFQYYKGIELLKHLSTDTGDWDFQLAYGDPKHQLEDVVQGKSVQLAAVRYGFDSGWIRAAVLHGDYKFGNKDGVVVASGAEEWIYSLEGESRVKSFVINAGVSDGDTEYIPIDRLAYFSVGYQLDKITPYALVSYREQEFKSFQRREPPRVTPPPQTVPPPVPPPIVAPPSPSGVNRASSVAIGARWSLNERLSLKFQAERSKVDDDVLANGVSGEGNVFTVVLEGVF